MTDTEKQNALLAALRATGAQTVPAENAAQKFNRLRASPEGPNPLALPPKIAKELERRSRPSYEPSELFGMVRELPMYGTIKLWGPATSQFAKLTKYEAGYDWYCPGCKRETPWRAEVSAGAMAQTKGYGGITRLLNICRRDESHEEVIYLEFTERNDILADENQPAIIRKIGQTPSLAEFHSNDVAEFEKVTTRAQRSDYLKSVQAFTQGFSAGACTYLRRVVEGILDQERDAEMQAKGITEWPDYQRADVKGRMKLLGDRLPEFLVENPMLYKVLSHGIHSLSEEDCAALYPKLRNSIQLLFEDCLEKYRKVQHRAKLAKELNQVETGKK
ncbi:hypothetical protein ACSFBX_11235 [Variovorax sp. RB2P76]|uniref:hypothetical protein n=1 Tax=Variovorax sp. RB2P76 TaxID=3443736 RepID=UPI003F453ECE